VLRVLCAIDEASGTTAALHAAIAFCRHQDAELGLVGVVRPGLLGRRRGTRPERLRRYADVTRSLEWAAEVAGHAGLCPTVAIRAGDPRRELVAEGRATGASGLFLARTRGRLAAALERRPRIAVEEILLVTQRPLASGAPTSTQQRSEKGVSR
jgi:hypothetical protein